MCIRDRANIPYGLVIAYALVIISTWSARSRDGVSGLALHLISSSLVVWTVMAGYGPGGDAMIPVGFGETATLPYFSNNAGYFWLYGVVLIPLIMLALPKSWFTMPPRTEDDSTDCLLYTSWRSVPCRAPGPPGRPSGGQAGGPGSGRSRSQGSRGIRQTEDFRNEVTNKEGSNAEDEN